MAIEPMNLFPPFDWNRVVILPWTRDLQLFGWITLMGFLVTLACGWVGKFLILRRMSLVGDAISHSVLPGLVIAFLIARNRSSGAMFLGALAAAFLTTTLIEWVHRRARLKQDAAIGVVFSSLFAIGVVLISLFADRVDLDQDCVLNGELSLVPLVEAVEVFGWQLGPPAVVRMAIVAFLTVMIVLFFYKELVVTSFDAVLASSLGIRSTWVHHGLMLWLSVVVVSAFEAVGAILVIAMLILPGATAALLADRLPTRLGLTVLHSLLSSVFGMHLGVWLDCSIAAAMVVAGSGLFVLAWFFNPTTGLVWRWGRGAMDSPNFPDTELQPQRAGVPGAGLSRRKAGGTLVQAGFLKARR